MARELQDKLITNYIYLYHTDEWVLIPVYPDQIADSMGSTFQQTNALSRSAPVFSYNYSGPRTVQINLALHRDMMDEANYGESNLKVEIGDDYIDTLVKRLQSIALPKYQATSKSVVPPMIAVRFGNEIFVKGIISDKISVTRKKPLFEDDKLAQIDVAFVVTEVDPYDADTVAQQGSFRGLTRTFKDGIFNG